MAKQNKYKDTQLSDLCVFYNRYITIEKFESMENPTQSNIIDFCIERKIEINEYNKNIIAMFVWEFWNEKEIKSGLKDSSIADFLIKHGRV